MRRLRIFLVFAVLLLLAIVAPPFVNINRFRRGIVQSISKGLGHPVHADTVELILLPRPSFVLHNLTVAEDPAYGAEPVLMADTVTASLRASTLWHRRVEIATLHFSAPSLNLTRNSAGRWNFETLLHWSGLPASSSSKEPTSSARLPFPYVEASEARINFKLGAEKLPFSLEGTDLAVWKESGSEWHLRVKARPVRTDLTVADAGQIRGEAVLQAASPLEDAPIRMKLEWRQVQLGEIGRMLHGEDDNWRGIVDWTAQAQGTLASTHISTDVQISEFRRAEFVPAAEMDLHVRCRGTFVRASNALDALQCSAPVGTGLLRLQGRSPLPLSGVESSAAYFPSAIQPITNVTLQHVPTQFFLDLFRHIHPGVSGNAAMTGELNGAADCAWQGIHTLKFCVGQVQSTALALTLPQLARPIQFSPLTLVASAAAPLTFSKQSPKTRSSRGAAKRNVAIPDFAIANTPPGAWQLQPLRISMGAGTPTMLSGTFTSTEAKLKITGPADLREVLRLSQALRIPAISGKVRVSQGNAQLALELRGAWLPQPAITAAAGTQSVQFAPSQWTGNMQIHNAIVTLAALRGPLQLASAQIDVTRDTVAWSRLRGSYGRVLFDGSLRWQTTCAASTPICPRKFLLHIPNLNVANFVAVLHAGKGPSSLLDIVNPWAASTPELPLLQGRVNVDLLTLGKLPIENAAFHLVLNGHRAELLSLSGNLLGGTISAGDPAGSDDPSPQPRLGMKSPTEAGSGLLVAGSARWGDGAPVYALRATLAHIQPDAVAALWNEDWGRGVADANFSLTAQGWSAPDLARHAKGKFSIHWANGSLISTGSAATTMTFQSWRATGQLSDQALVLHSSQIVAWNMDSADGQSGSASASTTKSDPAAGVQTVTGSISFARALDLKLQPSGITVTGTLAAPQITENKKRTGSIDTQP